MDPSHLPEVQAYPYVRRLLADQIDMQFEDIRTLLRLPLDDPPPKQPPMGDSPVKEPPLRGGCNLTTATLLFNVIAGASVLFYESSPEGLAKGGDRGPRFKDLLTDYFPWADDEAFDRKKSSKVVYDFARNPLTHSLGVQKVPKLFPGVPPLPDGAQAMMLEKGPLDVDAVAAVTDPSTRPEWLGPTLRREDDELASAVDLVTRLGRPSHAQGSLRRRGSDHPSRSDREVACRGIRPSAWRARASPSSGPRGRPLPAREHQACGTGPSDSS